jgi:hypothetical protein
MSGLDTATSNIQDEYVNIENNNNYNNNDSILPACDQLSPSVVLVDLSATVSSISSSIVLVDNISPLVENKEEVNPERNEDLLHQPNASIDSAVVTSSNDECLGTQEDNEIGDVSSKCSKCSCISFHSHAWKKGKCRDCFHTLADHNGKSNDSNSSSCKQTIKPTQEVPASIASKNSLRTTKSTGSNNSITSNATANMSANPTASAGKKVFTSKYLSGTKVVAKANKPAASTSNNNTVPETSKAPTATTPAARGNAAASAASTAEPAALSFKRIDASSSSHYVDKAKEAEALVQQSKKRVADVKKAHEEHVERVISPRNKSNTISSPASRTASQLKKKFEFSSTPEYNNTKGRTAAKSVGANINNSGGSNTNSSAASLSTSPALSPKAAKLEQIPPSLAEEIVEPRNNAAATEENIELTLPSENLSAVSTEPKAEPPAENDALAASTLPVARRSFRAPVRAGDSAAQQKAAENKVKAEAEAAAKKLQLEQARRAREKELAELEQLRAEEEAKEKRRKEAAEQRKIELEKSRIAREQKQRERLEEQQLVHKRKAEEEAAAAQSAEEIAPNFSTAVAFEAAPAIESGEIHNDTVEKSGAADSERVKPALPLSSPPARRSFRAPVASAAAVGALDSAAQHKAAEDKAKAEAEAAAKNYPLEQSKRAAEQKEREMKEAEELAAETERLAAKRAAQINAEEAVKADAAAAAAAALTDDGTMQCRRQSENELLRQTTSELEDVLQLAQQVLPEEASAEIAAEEKQEVNPIEKKAVMEKSSPVATSPLQSEPMLAIEPVVPSAEYVKSAYAFKAQVAAQLSCAAGEYFRLIHSGKGDWLQCENLKTKHTGLLPANYVKSVPEQEAKAAAAADNINQPAQSASTNVKKPSSATSPAASQQSAECLYNYTATGATQLSFQKGENISIFNQIDTNWYKARNSSGQEGLVPANYIKLSNSGAAEPQILAEAVYDLPKVSSAQQLTFKKGEIFIVLDKTSSSTWFKVQRKESNSVGVVPANYVKILSIDSKASAANTTSATLTTSTSPASPAVTSAVVAAATNPASPSEPANRPSISGSHRPKTSSSALLANIGKKTSVSSPPPAAAAADETLSNLSSRSPVSDEPPAFLSQAAGRLSDVVAARKDSISYKRDAPPSPLASLEPAIATPKSIETSATIEAQAAEVKSPVINTINPSEPVKDSEPAPGSSSSSATSPPPAAELSATTVEIVEGLYDFKAQKDLQLSFSKGEKLLLVQRIDNNWIAAKSLSTNAEGYIPSNYIKVSTVEKSTINNTEQPAAQSPIINKAAPPAMPPRPSKPSSSAVAAAITTVNTLASTVPPTTNETKVTETTAAAPTVTAQSSINTASAQPQAKAKALYNFAAPNPAQLSLKQGELLNILHRNVKDWVFVSNAESKTGLVPANYISELADTTPFAANSTSPASPTSPVATHAAAAAAAANSAASVVNTIPSTGGESYVALYAFTAQVPAQLSLVKGESLTILKKDNPQWFLAKNASGVTGLVPNNYVKLSQNNNSANISNANSNNNTSNPTVPATAPKRSSIIATTAPVAPATSSQSSLSSSSVSPSTAYPAVAIFPYTAHTPPELSVAKNESIKVLGTAKDSKDWVEIENEEGKRGLVPANYTAAVIAEGVALFNYAGTKPENADLSPDAVFLAFEAGEALLLINKDPQTQWACGISVKSRSQGLFPLNYIKEKSQILSQNASQPSSGPSFAQGATIRAVYSFTASHPNQFSFKSGDTFVVVSQDKGWIAVSSHEEPGKRGLVPANYFISAY